jgi:SAM-dependent methyltransferase
MGRGATVRDHPPRPLEPRAPPVHPPPMSWDARYDRPDYLFGTEPAAFVRRTAPLLPPASRILAVADGEGRNSVHLATLGHHVTAMDASPVALTKARRLAEARGAAVDLHEADILAWDWAASPADVLLAVFIQFLAPRDRARVFAGFRAALRPGGLLLLHGYAPRQVDYGTGGPPSRENMYTLPLLEDAFAGFDIIDARDYDAEIAEGSGHAGRSALIDFVARAPA